MDRAAADALLADLELVPAVEASVAAARELERRLLANEIPAMLAKPEACCSTGGCAPKLQVLVREQDVPRLGQLLKDEWIEALEREGTLAEGLTQLGTPATGDALACPACGFSGPLVEGACGDCGLQLE